jgi:hypothetical protein
MFSNHSAPLNIEEGDRRYFVVNSMAEPRPDGYYEQLYRYIESEEGMTAIYSYLMKRDIASFNPHRRPPVTAAKEAVIAVSGNPMRAYIREAVESGHFYKALGGQEVTLDAIQRQLQKDGYGPQSKNLRELGEALAEAGVTQIRRTVSGKKRRLHRLPERWDEGRDMGF